MSWDMMIQDCIMVLEKQLAITSGKIAARSRAWPEVRVRQAIYYWLYYQHGWSYSAIGRYFGVDHTTVNHGVKTARKHMRTDSAVEMSLKILSAYAGAKDLL